MWLVHVSAEFQMAGLRRDLEMVACAMPAAVRATRCIATTAHGRWVSSCGEASARFSVSLRRKKLIMKPLIVSGDLIRR